MLSKALALDPNFADATSKALALKFQFRLDEAVAEDQRAVDWDPADVFAYGNMGYAYRRLGQFETSLELIDKAIRLSPHDPFLLSWYADKAGALVALKQYDQAIDRARRAIAIGPNYVTPHIYLIASLALSGQESQAHEAFQRYIAVPGAVTTLAANKAARAQYVNEHTDPRYVEYWDRLDEGLRKAGLPEE